MTIESLWRDRILSQKVRSRFVTGYSAIATGISTMATGITAIGISAIAEIRDRIRSFLSGAS